MRALELVKLPPLMAQTSGRPEIVIALIDGPVAVDHADLPPERVRVAAGAAAASCSVAESVACRHGTFVAGILSAQRGSGAPAIAPACTLLVRPIFPESEPLTSALPSATPDALITAITDCLEAGARILNLSLGLAQPSTMGLHRLEQVLEQAAQRGALVVAAAGNQGAVGGSAITRHPWVIPVAACDQRGAPTGQSNLGHAIGRRGLRVPGKAIQSLSANGKPQTMDGTSVAAPFVTGAAALLWSLFPNATAAQVKHALLHAPQQRRISIVPPLLDAQAAYHHLAQFH